MSNFIKLRYLVIILMYCFIILVICESDDDTYEWQENPTKNMTRKISNKKMKRQTKRSLVTINVSTPSSPVEDKVAHKNKTRTLKKKNKIVANKHIVKPPPSVLVLKRNKKEMQSLDMKNDVEEDVLQKRNMEIVAKKIVPNEQTNTTKVADTQRKIKKISNNKNESLWKHQNKSSKFNITNEIESNNFNQSPSSGRTDSDEEDIQPLSSVAKKVVQNQKISSPKVVLRASRRETCSSNKTKQILRPTDQEEYFNENKYKSLLSVQEKHKNIVNKINDNVDQDVIANSSAVRKKVVKKKKINILKVMDNRIGGNKDMVETIPSVCDKAAKEKKKKTSTMKVNNEGLDNEEYADKNVFQIYRSIDDKVPHEASTSKITDDIVEDIFDGETVVPSNKKVTIIPMVGRKESKNWENISQMHSHRILNTEKIEADVLYPGQLKQVQLSSGKSFLIILYRLFQENLFI